MANLFDQISYKPDVLTCLADLSNDEVMTPPDTANQMLDMLPKEIWSDPKIKILDPACKSGVFLREAAKRFIEGEKDIYPDLRERIEHIFKEQLFGIAITEMTSLLSRRTLYCSKYPNGPFSVAKFEKPEGNIRFKTIKHTWSAGRCAFCGASRSEYDRNEGLETHAYEFIHMLKAEEIFDMKFDVICSNPPYQLSDGGQKASATPIYQKFVQQSKKLNPRYMTFVIPARWFSGGRGLDQFRDDMLNDTRVRVITDFTDSNDCFPGVDIAGGVCYFLWDRDSRGECEVTTIHNGKKTSAIRRLNEFPIFIRHNDALSIVKKVLEAESHFYSERVSSQKPFGLRTYVKPTKTGDIQLRYNGGIGPFMRRDVPAQVQWIDKWKLIMSYLTYDHAGRADKDGRRRIFSTTEILPPGCVCTETYLVVDAVDTEKEIKNIFKYMQTKFVRFLVAQTTSTQHIAKANFSFVPILDFTEEWTDEKLYKRYNLTNEEIQFIESMIKPMDLSEEE